jgi:uncharacterized protein
LTFNIINKYNGLEMYKRALFFLFLLASFAGADIPRPLGWVSDYAELLDRAGEEKISSVITSIRASTGADIAVVTRNSLDDFGSPEGMALAYLEEWGLGEKGKDNGLLLLILYAPESNLRDYRFETGLGLEGDLPDGLLGQIAREELVPRFRQGDYSGGVLAAVIRIGTILGADLSAQGPSQKPVVRKKGIGSLIFIIFLIMIILSRGKRGGGLLGLLLLGSMLGGGRRSGGFGGGGFGGFGGFGGGGGGAGGGAGGRW